MKKMGNDLSSTPVLPLNFRDCFTEGKIDIKKCQLHLLVIIKREDSLELPIDSSVNTLVDDDNKPAYKKRT